MPITSRTSTLKYTACKSALQKRPGKPGRFAAFWISFLGGLGQEAALEVVLVIAAVIGQHTALEAVASDKALSVNAGPVFQIPCEVAVLVRLLLGEYQVYLTVMVGDKVDQFFSS